MGEQYEKLRNKEGYTQEQRIVIVAFFDKLKELIDECRNTLSGIELSTLAKKKKEEEDPELPF